MSIFGFKSPASARMGNFFGLVGMLTAIAGTVGSHYVYGYGYIIFAGCFVACGGLGVLLAAKVKMTSMPQMVGMLNALGGLAAALESVALYMSPFERLRQLAEGQSSPFQIYNSVFYVLGLLIGTMTFTGSIIACLKLGGKISGNAARVPGRLFWNVVLLIAMIACPTFAAVAGLGDTPVGIAVLCGGAAAAAIYGVLMVIVIGGADMPVVIALLNSLSGWSTVFAGLTFSNSLMIIAGAFVGASGIVLSILMCQAMNRSLTNVLMGGFGGEATAPATEEERLDVHVADVDIVSRYLAGSQSIVIIPGYGMAVSRAQHAVASLADILRASGRSCRFAVHPVAGRLPGHMNVLLAEAGVSYDVVDDLEGANGSFEKVDTCIVIGANDTVNPAAVNDKSCAIYGMPVLQCWKAKRTVVIKRSLNTGYAGIDNPLFTSPGTSMLLGDGKDIMEKLIEPVRERVAAKPEASPSVFNFITAEEERVQQRYELETKLKEGGNQEADDEPSEESHLFRKSKPQPVIIGVVGEDNDNRVAIVPKDVRNILKGGYNARIVVEQGAGLAAGVTDQDYEEAGAQTFERRKDVYRTCDLVFKVTSPSLQEMGYMVHDLQDFEATERVVELTQGGKIVEASLPLGCKKSLLVTCFSDPFHNAALIDTAASNGISWLSLDIMPRVTAAQAMDVLSSAAKVAGYRAVLEAVHRFGRLPGPEITAAGSYPPAKVLVVGAGVAGLQAIGDAHRLGADVRAFDVRKECADQVKSMGGKFLVLDFEEDGAGAGGYANIMSEEFIAKEMELFSQQAAECDIFILTAAIPGRKAPILLKEEHVKLMRRGSVLVDLAAPTGGNCEITRPGENYTTDKGVQMVGCVDFVSTTAAPISSEMLSANVLNLLQHITSRSNSLKTLDVTDPILRAILLSHGHLNLFPSPRRVAPPAPAAKVLSMTPPSSKSMTVIEAATGCAKMSQRKWALNSCPAEWLLLLFIAAVATLLSFTAPMDFVGFVMILFLGSWVGYLLVCGVTSALHTPLMSLTNAISGVVILAALVTVSPGWNDFYSLRAVCSINNVPISDADGNPMVAWYCEERGLVSIILNALAICAASMNVLGGFAVTSRMLSMFKALKA
ncbi:MAG: uncharacterized protein KVP18_004358 [Porospora cf. gigantea A]|nr:MAG: hypothetical protein KVP18_004358 [Porospora cf. gigantea A]